MRIKLKMNLLDDKNDGENDNGDYEKGFFAFVADNEDPTAAKDGTR